MDHRYEAAMAMEKKKIEQQAKPEQKESERSHEELGFALRKTTLLVMDRLLKLSDEKGIGKQLPRSERMGAAFVPAILMTAMIGCGGAYDIQECSPEVDEYLSASLSYLDSHREEIQAELDCMSIDVPVPADDIIDTALNAVYTCSPNLVSKEGADAAAMAFMGENMVSIDISEDEFQKDLSTYQDTKWVADKSIDELRLLSHINWENREDTEMYFHVLSSLMDTLAHEAAHLELDEGHSDKTKQTVLDVQSGDAYYSDIAYIDTVYSFGTSALMAGLDTRDDVTDYLKAPIGSKQPKPTYYR